MTLLLIVSHDQLLVECILNLKNNILKTNMGSETVIAKELIISYMVGDSLKPNTFEITKPMLKAFRSAHLYKIHLEE